MSKKLNYRELTPTGKCKICSINLWAEHDNKPAIFPCGVPLCPYPSVAQPKLEHSQVGSSLSHTVYES